MEAGKTHRIRQAAPVAMLHHQVSNSAFICLTTFVRDYFLMIFRRNQLIMSLKSNKKNKLMPFIVIFFYRRYPYSELISSISIALIIIILIEFK